uniref:Uncharacterized protein n=1 Tax=Pyxicephalus adspersus TaxID=30357 RepID=A0AAV3AQU1_PYXAD|nr:TPA: hypothetical protein GDO54_005951 [Pyxicephalus adspersus]
MGVTKAEIGPCQPLCFLDTSTFRLVLFTLPILDLVTMIWQGISVILLASYADNSFDVSMAKSQVAGSFGIIVPQTCDIYIPTH